MCTLILTSTSTSRLYMTLFPSLSDNVCWLPHNPYSMGQDPSFCLIPTDWWSVVSHRHRIHHCRLTFFSIVSLQQMVLFGQNPGQGTLLRASQFLAGMSFASLASHLTQFQQRSSPSVSPIASKSLMSCPTTFMLCPPYEGSGTGMPSPSRSVPSPISFPYP